MWYTVVDPSGVNKDWTCKDIRQGQGQGPSLQGLGQGQGLDLQGQGLKFGP